MDGPTPLFGRHAMSRLNDLYPDQHLHPPTIWAEARPISKEFLLSITGRKEGPSQDKYFLTRDNRGVLVQAWDTGFIITVLRLGTSTVMALNRPLEPPDTEDAPSPRKAMLQDKLRELYEDPTLMLRVKTSIADRVWTLIEQGTELHNVNRRWFVPCPNGQYLIYRNYPGTVTIHFLTKPSGQ